MCMNVWVDTDEPPVSSQAQKYRMDRDPKRVHGRHTDADTHMKMRNSHAHKHGGRCTLTANMHRPFRRPLLRHIHRQTEWQTLKHAAAHLGASTQGA